MILCTQCLVVWALLSHVISGWTVSRFDLAQNRTLYFDVDISLQSDIDTVASQICGDLYYDADIMEISRCTSMAFHTIRDHKLKIIKDMCPDEEAPVGSDIETLALQYAYENTENDQNNERVFIVGVPSYQTMIIILGSARVQVVWVFAPAAVKVDHWIQSYQKYCVELAVALNKKVRFVFGDALESIKQLRQLSNHATLCEVLHIQDSSAIYAVERFVEEVLSTTHYDGGGTTTSPPPPLVSPPPPSPLRVVWVQDFNMERNIQDFPVIEVAGRSFVAFNATAGIVAAQSLRTLNCRVNGLACCLEQNHQQHDQVLGGGDGDMVGTAAAATTATATTAAAAVRWQMSSVWLLQSQLRAVSNYDGFNGRTYTAMGDWMQLRRVSIGVVDRPHIFPSDLPAQTRDPVAGNGYEVTIVITYTIRVFWETANGLKAALQRLGYNNVFILPDLTLPVTEYLRTSSSRQQAQHCHHTHMLLQIAIGAHDFTMLLPHYVVFQMEQVWSPIAFAGRARGRYGLVLAGAACILSYSPMHAALLRDLGYPCVYVIPLYSLDTETEAAASPSPAGYASTPASAEAAISPTTPTDRSLLSAAVGDNNHSTSKSNGYYFDMMFYGSCSDRRRYALIATTRHFADCRQISGDSNGSEEGDQTTAATPAAAAAAVRCYRYIMSCVDWSSGVFDAMRLMHLSLSSVVLNLHHDDESVLEAHRLNFLLSLGKCVVSERSDDTELDAIYEQEQAIRFIERVSNKNITLPGLASMYETVDRLLHNRTDLLLCEQNARSMYAKLMGNVTELDKAMKHTIRLL